MNGARLIGTPLTGAFAATARPFTRLGSADAQDIMRTIYGRRVTAPITRLATERDDTFRVVTDDGTFVLKVAHPDDDPLTIDLQTSALEHAATADPSLPLQSVIVASDGSREPRLPLGDGQVRVVRLLTYLSGTLLRDSSPTPAQLRSLGRIQARLGLALKDFDHPAADRRLLFDLQNFAQLRRFASMDTKELTLPVFAWFDEVLTPNAAALPRQVLHTDFGLDNVVVEESAATYVTGILDWGDVVRTWRAADLASGLASQIPPDGPPWVRADAMLVGYQSVLPLTATEEAMLPGLVAMRLAQRILLALWLSSSRPSNADYLRRNLATSYRQLANLEY
jgi:hydroxylysine kinase